MFIRIGLNGHKGPENKLHHGEEPGDVLPPTNGSNIHCSEYIIFLKRKSLEINKPNIYLRFDRLISVKFPYFCGREKILLNIHLRKPNMNIVVLYS